MIRIQGNPKVAKHRAGQMVKLLVCNPHGLSDNRPTWIARGNAHKLQPPRTRERSDDSGTDRTVQRRGGRKTNNRPFIEKFATHLANNLIVHNINKKCIHFNLAVYFHFSKKQQISPGVLKFCHWVVSGMNNSFSGK